LECATEGKVDFIISKDKHLLNLKEFRGIKIINPSDFLKSLESI
jgi:predicted nucleic acid-binding protein